MSPGEWYFAASNEETLTDEVGQSKFYSTIEAFPQIHNKPGVVPPIQMTALQTFTATQSSI